MKITRTIFKISIILAMVGSLPQISAMKTKEQHIAYLHGQISNIKQKMRVVQRGLFEISDPKFNTKEEIDHAQDNINYFEHLISQYEKELKQYYQQLKQLQ